MSLPQPPIATTLQDSRALPSLSPSTRSLPPPQFTPGAHLDRDQAFALKRPGDEVDTRTEARVAKKPKHSRGPSDAPAPIPSSAPPPTAATAAAAAAAAAEVPAAPTAAPPADTPVGRLHLWLNAVRLPTSPPPNWPGDQALWTTTALEEFRWMKGEFADGGSSILGEAWKQL
jgi:hypothetical protein